MGAGSDIMGLDTAASRAGTDIANQIITHNTLCSTFFLTCLTCLRLNYAHVDYMILLDIVLNDAMV